MRVRGISINGGLTDAAHSRMSYEDAKTEATENSRNNAWNVNNDGNVNTNNKYNRNNCLAVAACVEFQQFREGVQEAFEECIANKRTSPQCIEYMHESAEDVEMLTWELYTMTWEPGMSRCFLVKVPKLRECFAAAFRDRVIHHWICIRLLPLFEKRCEELGNVSHACRKGFGTLTAIKQVQDGMCRVSSHFTKGAWVYKGDIVGFFMNINQQRLWKMIENLIESKYKGADRRWLLYACKKCIIHRPEKNCEVVSDPKMWNELPKHKTLFYGSKENGEPIGNLTTQHFAGYYMSFMDEFILRLFKRKNFSYTRSVDDFVIVCDNKRFLLDSIKKIDIWLGGNLSLTTHKESVYLQKVSHGVKFLGVWIKPHRTYTIERTVSNFNSLLDNLFADCKQGLTAVEVDAYQSRINSYLGLLRQTKSYNIRTRLLDAPKEFFSYFYIVNMKKIMPRKQYRHIA